MILNMILAGALQSSGVALSPVTLQYVPCETPSVPASVRIYQLDLERFVKASSSVRAHAGYQTVSVQLPEGYYEILLRAPRCSATVRVPVLRSHAINLALSGFGGIMFHEGGAAIAGTLPARGMRVEARCTDPTAKDENYVADVIDDAYYFRDIRTPASCDIGVKFANVGDPKTTWLFRNVRLSLDKGQRYVIRNISWPLVEAAFKTTLP